MKTLLITIIFLIIAGCIGCEREIEKPNIEYSIRIIDGCEYIQVENSYKTANNYNYTLTHKGNCKNPIHKCIQINTPNDTLMLNYK